jgi:hypothetical protein
MANIGEVLFLRSGHDWQDTIHIAGTVPNGFLRCFSVVRALKAKKLVVDYPANWAFSPPVSC